MDPGIASERSAELVEAIEAELGPDWLKLPSIAGIEKSIVVWNNDTIALASRDWAFYLVDGELWSRIRGEGNVLTGRWVDGELEVVASAPAPDPSQN